MTCQEGDTARTQKPMMDKYCEAKKTRREDGRHCQPCPTTSSMWQSSTLATRLALVGQSSGLTGSPKLISVRASLCASNLKVWREREPYVGSDRQINLKAHHGKQPIKPMIRHCRATQVTTLPLTPPFCKTT